MSVDADTYGCKYPSCTRAAGVTVIDSAEEGVALCEEHRHLLIEDPTEFRRLWEALDPRQQDAAPVFRPRQLEDPA